LIPTLIPLSRRQLGLATIAIAAIAAMITPFLYHAPSQTQASIPTTPGTNHGTNGNTNGGTQGTSTTGAKHSGGDSDNENTETGDSGSNTGHSDKDDQGDTGSHSTHTGQHGSDHNDDQSTKAHSHTEVSQPENDSADSIRANKQSNHGNINEQHGPNDDQGPNDEDGS
jgi:hypothetical protein